jgi:cellulose synthase/poly-beta-1,6-N-acetylglucosamine synthase-like glycosyltransferase
MSWLAICFWLCAACVLYTYAGYPLLLALAARLWRRPVRRGPELPRSVSIVLAAYNEAAHIDRKLHELTGMLKASGLEGEVLVVSDGSTDGTADLARGHAGWGVRVIELPANQGKAAALTQGCAAAKHEVIVLTDARQSWAPDALVRLLENFTGDGVLGGVSLYWRIEKWLRKKESQVWSQAGVSGSISAVRRALFRPVPPGTILDDVYWPLQVVFQGYRVVHDDRARAFDRLPRRSCDEFRRKVRTLSGNLQLLTLQPRLLLPWRNPLWPVLVSHKLLRLLVPWALVALLPLSALLRGPFYEAAFAAQLAGYTFALLGLATPTPGRLSSTAASFLVLNGAALAAFWVWLGGRSGRSWRKVPYDGQPLPALAGEARPPVSV